jgi:hypothetical protein
MCMVHNSQISINIHPITPESTKRLACHFLRNQASAHMMTPTTLATITSAFLRRFGSTRADTQPTSVNSATATTTTVKRTVDADINGVADNDAEAGSDEEVVALRDRAQRRRAD